LPRTEKAPLDKLLVARGLAATLSEAQALVMAGIVIVDDHAVDKSKSLIPVSAHIRLKRSPKKYASRGGTKLEKPLDTFNIPVTDKTVLDVGASTGGFTDCLLQRGARVVYAIDVGYGQLAWKLREDPRVKVLERANICALSRKEIPVPADLAVIDVSFTSLKKIWPSVIPLLKLDGALLSLVKPQFEAKKEEVEAGGLVRNIKTYQKVMQSLVEAARALSLHVVGIMESPIRGQKGNREFFLYAIKKS
jgi:23S rRNA (cytidine1920-2'-O)/16S rRNA (cytidine1409-2'-O)-methyltransferase